MKKIISILLTVVMVFSLAVPALAYNFPNVFSGSDIPVIAIFGDGEAIYNTEGKKIFHFSELLNTLGGSEDGAAGEAVQNVLKPFLIEGILKDEWDNYYAALGKEIGDLFAEARYDNNGENPNGSDVSKDVRKIMADNLQVDKKTVRGSYYVYDYQFWYDWRQDPLVTADEFHAYIQGIKDITGAPKVSVIARCLGTTVVLAYLSKYGTADLHGVSFNGSVADGGEIISETISGKFKLDLNAINRMILDFDSMGKLDIDNFITSSIDLAAKSSELVGFKFEKTKIYGKLVQGVTSALALSTFFTWPGYWALVAEEDYQDALLYVFGEEGSDKRAEYAELIKKIDNYHTNVTKEIWNILGELKEKEIIVGVIAKYGFQIAPVIESCDAIGDQFASVTRASFGATTTTIYDTFSEEYINKRKEEGKDKYISPDRHIDASTCFFPDSTWFTKDITHSKWTDFETSLLYQVVTAEKQLTIDDFDCTQYVVYDNDTNTVDPMTEENCDTEAWVTDKDYDEPESFLGRFIAYIKSLVNWFNDLITKLLAFMPQNPPEVVE